MGTTNTDITQIIEVMDDESTWTRDKRLVELMHKYHSTRKNRILIFTLYKKDVSKVEHMLQNKGFVVGSMSSDRSQHERTKALAAFKDGSCPVLVATDVAARGLDIP